MSMRPFIDPRIQVGSRAPTTLRGPCNYGALRVTLSDPIKDLNFFQHVVLLMCRRVQDKYVHKSNMLELLWDTPISTIVFSS